MIKKITIKNSVELKNLFDINKKYSDYKLFIDNILSTIIDLKITYDCVHECGLTIEDWINDSSIDYDIDKICEICFGSSTDLTKDMFLKLQIWGTHDSDELDYCTLCGNYRSEKNKCINRNCKSNELSKRPTR